MIVAFTVHNRPAYLRETLESWREVRGVGGVSAVFSCEPGCEEAVQLCESVDFFWSRGVWVHPERLGVLRNPQWVLDWAFVEEETFAVLAEEDIVVSSDALEYLYWAAGEFGVDPRVLAVTTHQRTVQPGGLPGVSLQQRFNGWVWGTWLDRWEVIGKDWDADYRHRGWDHRLNDYWCGELGYQVAAPSVARSQHIGREGGSHCSPEMFDGLACEGFQREVPPQEYRLIRPD